MTTASPAPPVIVEGKQGAYALEAEHGQGAFGITYRARRVSDDLPVVVKLLRLDRLGDWHAYDLFERESAVLRAVAHPGIPSWVDHFPLGDPGAPRGFALVQTFVEGPTLAQVMRTPGALSPDGMLAWFEDLLGILEYLHGRVPPVIHRDVTPKNVILRAQGRVALVDFGSVQAALQRDGALATTSAGTFGYAAPEQFLGRAGPESDLYGAAMTFLAVASGREPGQLQIDGLRVNVPASLRADPRLIRLLAAMTETDPRARLADAALARRTVQRIRRPPPTSAPEARALAPPAPESLGTGAFLGELRARLSREEFTIAAGGEVGRTAIAFRASRGPRRWQRLPALHVYAAAAADLEGHPGGPLAAPPLVLLARAAAALHAGDGGWLEGVWAPRSTVVVVLAGARGLAPQAAARVEAALRSDRGPVLALALAADDGCVELVAPAAAWGAAHGDVSSYLARLLGGTTALLAPPPLES